MPGQCPRCCRQVYSAEERLALGRAWHQECFTCAVCNKSLDSTNITENQENQEIYCKNCYRVLYGTKGYGYGPNEPTLLAQNPPEEECYDITPSPSKAEVHQFNGKNKAVIVKPYNKELPFRKGYSYWGKRPTPRHYGNQIVPVPAADRLMKKCGPDQQYPPRQTNRSRSRSPDQDQGQCPPECNYPLPAYKNMSQPQQRDFPKVYQQSWLQKEPIRPANCQSTHRSTYRQQQSNKCVLPKPQQSWLQKARPENCEPTTTPAHCQSLRQAAAPSRSRSRQKTFRSGPNNRVDLCGRCGNPVYFAEKKLGYHGVYHTRCYVCCSCGKSLETTTVSEHNGVLYCKGCYKRFIATSGVGFGIGAGALQTH